MKKILISVLAGLSLTGSALAYELVHVRELKVGVQPDGRTYYEDRIGYSACMTRHTWDNYENVKREITPLDEYKPIVVDDVNKINPDWCTHKVSGESAPVVVIEKTPEPANNEDMVCTRIEGCEVDLNAVTPEEYCPTCVWKSELKKIKIINFI